MKVIILGTGCPKCRALEKAATEVSRELGLDATIEKEDDIMKIMEYGVLRTPGLVINGKLVLSGRVPSEVELKELLTQ